MKIAFVFPGQGSQHVGMAREIYENSEESRRVFQEASDVLGYDVADLCFNGPAEELNKTFRTQPCLLTASIALLRAAASRGLPKVSAVAGHSLGEYTALVAAGAISFTDGAKLTEQRGIFMQEAVPEGAGLMAAVLGLERTKVDELCASVKRGYAAPANYNCPGQIVIAGEKAGVEEAMELCKSAGAKRAIPLAVSVPSHCRLMEPASQRLAELIDGIEMRTPDIPVVNNAEGRFLFEVAEIKSSLVRQLRMPLLWEDAIRTAADSGINAFLEIGPGKVLSGLIRRIVPSAGIFNIDDFKSIEKVVSELTHLNP